MPAGYELVYIGKEYVPKIEKLKKDQRAYKALKAKIRNYLRKELDKLSK